MTETQIILLLTPLILIQLILVIVCLVSVSKKEKTKYLNKLAWILIILFINLIGSIAYLLIESEKNDSD